MTGFQNSAAELEKFIDDTQSRHLYYTLGGKDPKPKEPWSEACNESWFLLALQNVPRDELMKLENKPYWQYLHIGSSEPN